MLLKRKIFTCNQANRNSDGKCFSVYCYCIYHFIYYIFLLYGGIGDVFRSVQSIQEFQNFVFPMSVLGFIAFYVFISALSQFVLILFVWLIISLIRTINIALGFAGVILAVEFTLYKLLPIQSNLSILKCVNLFCFVDPTTEVAKYHNLNF